MKTIYKRLTKTQKHQFYKNFLNRYINEFGSIYLCVRLKDCYAKYLGIDYNDVSDDDKLIKVFPEFYTFKPVDIQPNDVWFESDSNKITNRIKMLESLIEQTASKSKKKVL